MTRFHLGTDIQGAMGTSVFAVSAGDVKHFRAGEWDERIDVGTYHYVHVQMSEALVGVLTAAESHRVTPTIAAGTLIGTTNDQNHCHLEYEPFTNHVQDALFRLVPWSDTVAPRFIVDPTGAAWQLPAVRVVRPFDPLDLSEVVPHLFGHTLPADGDSGTYPIPVVSGSVDVLARCMDALGTPAGGAAIEGAQNAAPVELGFGLDELPSSMLPPAPAVRRAAVPYHTTIDFDDIPRYTPEGSTDDTSCRHVYWVNHTIGSRVGAGSNKIGNLDYIVTSAMTDHAPLDTDNVATRNGRYQFVVKAHDISQVAADAAGIPITTFDNEVSSSRECVICNQPGTPSVSGIDRAVRSGPLTLTGYNFFTPLDLPQRTLPQVVFQQGALSPKVTPSAGRGTNARGELDVNIPGGIDLRKPFEVSVRIRCNPEDASDVTSGGSTSVVVTPKRATFTCAALPPCPACPVPTCPPPPIVPPLPAHCSLTLGTIQSVVTTQEYDVGGFVTIGGVDCSGQTIDCSQLSASTVVEAGIFGFNVIQTEVTQLVHLTVPTYQPPPAPPCGPSVAVQLLHYDCQVVPFRKVLSRTTVGINFCDPVLVAPGRGGVLGDGTLTVVAGGVDDLLHRKDLDFQPTRPDLAYVLGLGAAPMHQVGPTLTLEDGRVLQVGDTAGVVGPTHAVFRSGDTAGMATVTLQAYNTLPIPIAMLAATPSFQALEGLRFCPDQRVSGPVVLTCNGTPIGGHMLQIGLEQSVPYSAAIALDPGPLVSTSGAQPPPSFQVWPGQAALVQLRATDLSVFDAGGQHPFALSPFLVRSSSCP